MTALSSTEFLIQFRTGPMSRPDVVPGYLRRDFDPARLGAWLVWVVMWAMTIEDKANVLRSSTSSLFDSAVFVAAMAVICGCVAWLQIKEIKNGRLILC